MGQTTFPPTQGNLQYTTIPPVGAGQSIWEGVLTSSASATNTIIGTGSGLIAYSSANGTSVVANGTTTYLTANTPTVLPIISGSTSVTVKAPFAVPSLGTTYKASIGSSMSPGNATIATNGSGTWVVSGINSGNTGQVALLYSTDNGLTWNTGTGASGLVKYGNGYFVCVVSNNTSYYSTNGSTWTTTYPGGGPAVATTTSFECFGTNGSGTWIVLSYYTGSGTQSNASISRNNGATWSLIGSPFLQTNQYGAFTRILWTGSYWAAYQPAYFTTNGGWWISTDGTTWTLTGAGGKGIEPTNWAYGNGIWLGINKISGAVAASFDNFGSVVNTYSTMPFVQPDTGSGQSTGPYYLIYINNYWVGFQYGNNINTTPPINPNIYSANNGITWTQFTGPLSSNGANGTYSAAVSSAYNMYIEVASQGVGSSAIAITTMSSVLPATFALYQPSIQLH